MIFSVLLGDFLGAMLEDSQIALGMYYADIFAHDLIWVGVKFLIDFENSSLDGQNKFGFS